jgi:SOS-response transcriptional repressor LexA
MTRNQAAALAFIAKYLEEHGQSPSMDDIIRALGLKSKSGAARLVDALEEQGHIRRLRYRARSIQLIDPGEVKLNDEIFQLVQKYAQGHRIGVDTAANELLRQVLGAAA